MSADPSTVTSTVIRATPPPNVAPAGPAPMTNSAAAAPSASPAAAPTPMPVVREGRVHVLQLGPDLDVKGGMSSVARLICDHLPTYANIEHVPTMNEGSRTGRLVVYARACAAVRRACNSPDATVIHVHFASRGSTLRKLLLAQMVIRARRPLILHSHGASFDRFHRGLPRAVRSLVNRTLQQANVVIVLSSQWREFFIRECELAPSQVVVLPNPVQVSPRVPDRGGRAKVQFIHLGRLGRRKGGYDLVDAFAALPEHLRARATLVMAGDGEVEEMRARAAPLGDRVRVLSWIDPCERERLLAESDVFVLPSYAEGLPMALLEGMAAGLPAITTGVGGIPDVVTDGVEGQLVTPGKVDELTAALARYLDDDTARLAAGRRAHERALGYDVHAYARRLAGIYQRIAPVADVRI